MTNIRIKTHEQIMERCDALAGSVNTVRVSDTVVLSDVNAVAEGFLQLLWSTGLRVSESA